MTYSAGSDILASDYNTFSSNLNTVWNSLWGQTSVGTVSASGTVTAAQWASLAGTITNAYIHITGSNPSVASPSAGNNIAIIANLATAVTYIQNNPYSSYAFGTQTGLSSTSSAVGSANNAWQLIWTQYINFASGAARTYYFNAGGVVFLTFSKSSTGQTNDPTWNSLAASCNQISFTSTSASKTIAGVVYQGTIKQGGDGTPTVLRTDIGYAQLTGSPVTIFQQFYPTYPYTGSYIAVNASLDGPNSVLFQTYWYQPASGYAFEAVNISAGGVVAIYNTPPEQTYISNTWGSPGLNSGVQQ